MIGIGLLPLDVGGASLMFKKQRSLEGEFGGLIEAGMLDSFPLGSVTNIVMAGWHVNEGGIFNDYQVEELVALQGLI